VTYIARTQLILRTAGQLPGTIGRYRISDKLSLPILVGEIDEQSGLKRFDGSSPSAGVNRIYTATHVPEESAVLIATEMLPMQVSTPFSIADRTGSSFGTDLERFCRAVVFLIGVKEEGRWAPGFMLRTAGISADDSRAVNDEARCGYDLEKSIFVNLRNEKGARIGGTALYPAIGYYSGMLEIYSRVPGLPLPQAHEYSKSYLALMEQRIEQALDPK